MMSRVSSLEGTFTSYRAFAVEVHVFFGCASRTHLYSIFVAPCSIRVASPQAHSLFFSTCVVVIAHFQLLSLFGKIHGREEIPLSLSLSLRCACISFEIFPSSQMPVPDRNTTICRVLKPECSGFAFLPIVGIYSCGQDVLHSSALRQYLVSPVLHTRKSLA